jgi:5-hydroxyisourate hydrolase
MSPITTHVLDTALGRPAAGVRVELSRASGRGWTVLGRGVTDADGRCRGLLKDGPLPRGTYRLSFGAAAYFRKTKRAAFYPMVEVVFTARDARHHHVPLLLSPWGYTTYRGS